MRKTATTKIMIVYPNQLFCESIYRGLRQAGHVIAGQVHHLGEALLLIELAQPDLALLGSNLNEHEAFRLCRALRAQVPTPKVIIISAHADELRVQADAFQAGAVACLSPNLDLKAYRAAVADVLRGMTLIPHEALSPKLQPAAPTEKERAIIKLWAEDVDMTEKEIARQLSVSPNTVHTHIRHIYEKLGTHKRRVVILRALRRGWCD